MKIQLASDLHLECLSRWFPDERLVVPAPDADLLVLAGDIANGTDAIRLFGRWPVPVLYVMGNHEGYERDLDAARAALQRASAGTAVTFLDNGVVDSCRLSHRTATEPVRFLGATLWTDYRLPGTGLDQREQMARADAQLADCRKICQAGRPFTAASALAEHERSSRWLERELARPFDGRTVVVTHHAPHRDSVHESYAGNPLNAAFVSHLPDLVERADLWCHGHTHNSFDYTARNCRVVANPAGYAQNRARATAPSELILENARFEPMCVIEI